MRNMKNFDRLQEYEELRPPSGRTSTAFRKNFDRLRNMKNFDRLQEYELRPPSGI